MKPSETIARKLSEVRAVIGRYPVLNPRLFGSTARGEDTDRSDIDILVEPLAQTTLYDLAALEAELEELLDVPVEVVTPGAISSARAAEVLRDAKPL